MKFLRNSEPANESGEWTAASPHPESCPWCGQQQVRGIVSGPGDPRYRCAACNTTFFVHTPTPRPLVQRRSRVDPELFFQ